MDVPEDNGLSPRQLWGAVWILVAASVVVLIRLVSYRDDLRPETLDVLLWLALLVVLNCFAAAAVVLAGVKNAELRTAARIAAQRTEIAGGRERD